MSRPVLVTGASGFAGSHLLDLLADDGENLVGWSRRGHGPQLSTTVRCTWREVDVTDADDVDRAIADAHPSIIYHCAGDAQSNRSAEETGTTLSVNVRGTAHLLASVARHAADARVIVTGSALVYRPSPDALHEESPLGPSAGYGLSKLAQETLGLRAASLDGLDVVVARAFNHVGPRQSPAFVAASIARQVARMEAGHQKAELMVGNLDARRDLTDVRDTVRAYRALARSGRRGAAYNVCRGEAPPIRALVGGLIARSRVPIEVRIDPARLRPSDVPVVLGSHDRLTKETGWRPEIPFERTLDDLLDWWRSATGVRS